MFRGAQKHVICFDQGFKCFCEIFSLRLTTACFEATLDGWYFTSFIK